MKNQTPITELLAATHAGGRQSNDADTDLYNYYLQEARAEAATKMAKALQRRKSPTSIAHEALASCLDNAKQVDAPISSRDEFRRYLSNHINQKVSNAAKREQAGKRDVRRDATGVDSPDPEDLTFSPLNQAEARELAIQMVHCLYEEEDEARRAIVTLGLLANYSTEQIRDAIDPLIRDPQTGQVPPGFSLSSIRLTVANRKRILRERFGGHLQVDEENEEGQ